MQASCARTIADRLNPYNDQRLQIGAGVGEHLHPVAADIKELNKDVLKSIFLFEWDVCSSGGWGQRSAAKYVYQQAPS